MSSGRAAARRRAAAVVAAAVVAALAASLAGCGAGVDARAPAPAEIAWDRWGVPHVSADSDEALAFAFGWAQARAHGELLLQLYAQARGRAAELFGEGYLESDRWVRTVGIPERAERWRAEQEPRFSRVLEGFAAGVNAWARAHPDELGPARALLPIDAADVLAHQQRVTHFTFTANEGLPALGRRALGGSNAWAIARSKSASGAALLLANPHLRFGERFTFFEAHLVAPGFEAYGAALVGFPTLLVGFTRSHAWTHTLNAHDGADVYRLRLDGDGYLLDDERVPFERRAVELSVRTPSGALERRELVVRESVHGPVIASSATEAIALRVVGLDRPHALRQWWDMARARDLAEFEEALRAMQLPTLSVLYADRDGHVLHLFGGLTPVRPDATRDWSGLVPGDTRATLWSDVHPYDDLPRVLDPPSGWLQNANDPPWTTTFPAALDPDDFPPYLAPRFMHPRAQRSAKLLLGRERVSLDELVELKHDTRVELADRLLDDLVPLARASSDPLVRRAADVLAAWDRRVDADSSGALLFVAFLAKLRARGEPFAEPWDEARPLDTPDGLARPADALAALAEAAGELEAAGASLEHPWGALFRLRRDEVDLPASGAMGELGVFRVFDFAADADGKNRAVGGDAFVAAIELGETVRARVVLTYGNWSRPGSPHRTDQLPLASRGEMRDALFERADVEAALVERETFAAE